MNSAWNRLGPIFTLFEREYYETFKDVNDAEPNYPDWPYNWVNLEANCHLNWPYSWENTEKFGMPHCTWQIEDKTLYLTQVKLYSDTSFYSIESETLDLTLLFGDKVQDGMIEADWVSGVYLIKSGTATQRFGGWPGYYYTVFEVTGYTYIRLERGKLTESYDVPLDFDPENLPEDAEPGLRQIVEDYALIPLESFLPNHWSTSAGDLTLGN